MGEMSNIASQPSERYSEMTDDLMQTAGKTTTNSNNFMIASLESLQSNESNVSLLIGFY